MGNYNCRRFCGKDASFSCQNCLLKEIGDEQLVAELVRRGLVEKESGGTVNFTEELVKLVRRV